MGIGAAMEKIDCDLTVKTEDPLKNLNQLQVLPCKAMI